MKGIILLILYSSIGGIVYAWFVNAHIIHPLFSFGFFIIYGISGGLLFAKLDKKGIFI